jgi:hypothetical protein
MQHYLTWFLWHSWYSMHITSFSLWTIYRQVWPSPHWITYPFENFLINFLQSIGKWILASLLTRSYPSSTQHHGSWEIETLYLLAYVFFWVDDKSLPNVCYTVNNQILEKKRLVYVCVIINKNNQHNLELPSFQRTFAVTILFVSVAKPRE